MTNFLESSRKRKRRLIFIKAAKLFSLFGLAFGLILGFFYLPYLRINAVSIQGIEAVPRAALINELSSILSKKYFYLLPKDHFLLLPKEEIAANLAANLRIESFSIGRKLPPALEISLKEREAWAVYCAGAECFLADSAGFVFAPAPVVSGSAVFKVLDERPPAQAGGLGKNFLPPGKIAEISNFLERVEAKTGEEIFELEIKNAETFRLNLKNGGYLLVDLPTDLEKALENLALVWGELVSSRGQLEYIDLRFEGKVFYRLN